LGSTVGEVLGSGAALLQLCGYIFYIRQFLQTSIRPNAASWFMFSYGTALLVALEWANAASWAVLALPATCAAMSVIVALLCLRKDATDPVERSEKIVFAADIFLTIIFSAMMTGIAFQSLPPVAFLLVGNVTTFTAFLPIIASTWRSPGREQPGPWMVWAFAYISLFAATLWSDRGANPALLIYPTLSALLHAAIAVLVLAKRASRRIYVGDRQSIFIDQSGIEGRGIFAAISLARGDPVCTLRGEPRSGPVRSEVGPNWIGIGRDAWIDPELPLDHINHSCNANAAFGPGYVLTALRPIDVGEEITLDYSSTEADPTWSMECHCGSEKCRKVLYAIQISFADNLFPPPAAPALQNVWRNERARHTVTAFPQLEPAPSNVTSKPENEVFLKS
jgi:SET domain